MPTKHRLQIDVSSQHYLRFMKICDGKTRCQGMVMEMLIDFAYDAKFKPNKISKPKLKK